MRAAGCGPPQNRLNSSPGLNVTVSPCFFDTCQCTIVPSSSVRLALRPGTARPYRFAYRINLLAASLLRLAGVDPAQYDLAKIKHGGEPKVYRDEKVIDLKDGDAFVTVRQSAPVA